MDKAHREADKILADIIEKMTPIFEKVDSKVIERLKKYLQKFESQIAEHEQMVDDGEMTEAEYQQWLIATTTTGKEWGKVRDEITEDYHKATQDAMLLAGSGLAKVYLRNLTYTQQSITSAAKKYLKKQIKFSVSKKKRILPKSPDPVKNRKWHRRKIESVIRREMKKGHSIYKIARQLHRVTNMDRVSAYRAARTGVTAAENIGRVDAMIAAKEMGINYDKVWYATLDERTRTSHRVMHGERVPCDEYFSNGLFEPGDPEGEPEEIYNCRCTLLWVLSDQLSFDIEEGPDGMGKLEWSAQKPISKPYPKWRNK